VEAEPAGDPGEVEQRRERVHRALTSGALRMAFQPVLDLRDGRVIGVEALARFSLEPARTPDLWFAEAASVGLDVELEALAVRLALQSLKDLDQDLLLFLNASPVTVGSLPFLEALGDAEAARVVAEVREDALQGPGFASLRDAIAPIRALAVRLAIDDAGADPETLGRALDLTPEFLKLDMDICRHIHLDGERQARAEEVLASLRDRDLTVIAEGIQSRGEVDTLRELGVTHGQGYFLALPSTLPLGDLSGVAARLTGPRPTRT
jgi:EAL domain-containing protein (putative c-di-GMP-specific phosphodiesterase class I)